MITLIALSVALSVFALACLMGAFDAVLSLVSLDTHAIEHALTYEAECTALVMARVARETALPTVIVDRGYERAMVAVLGADMAVCETMVASAEIKRASARARKVRPLANPLPMLAYEVQPSFDAMVGETIVPRVKGGRVSARRVKASASA